MNEVTIYITKNTTPHKTVGSRWHTKAGRGLLCHALRNLTGDVSGMRKLTTHPGGKPYLKDSNIHFNISHSHEYAVCAVGSKELGIDIQYHKTPDIERVAKRVLTPHEWKSFQNSQNKSQYFYDRWTEKESYLKYTGAGIRSDLRTLMIDKVIQPVFIAKDYSATLCTQSDVLIKIVEIQFSTLLVKE